MYHQNQMVKLVQTALFMALCCVTTMAIPIPSPMGGYVNLGDCIALLSAWILGPIYGAVAAGLGSMLADILLGYTFYAPATLVIKASMAALAGILFMAMHRQDSATLAARSASAVAAEGLMVLGYLGFEGLILGYGAGALVNVPANLIQGVFSMVAALALSQMLVKGKVIHI